MAGLVPFYFPTNEASAQFNRLWRSRPVVASYCVDLEDIDGFGQTDLLRDMQWDGLYTLNAPVYNHLCRMFMSNIDVESVSRHPFRFVTWVCGQRLVITSALICEVLGCPVVDDVQFGLHELWRTMPWLDQLAAMTRVLGPRLTDVERRTFFDGRLHALKRKHLKLDIRPIQDVIQLVIIPRIGHYDEINIIDIVLLDCILQGRLVDIGALIIGHWLQVIGHSRAGIPHGMVITRILQHFGLNLEGEIIGFEHPNAIDANFLQRRSIHRTDTGDVFMTGRRASLMQPSQVYPSQPTDHQSAGPSDAGPSHHGPSYSRPSGAGPSDDYFDLIRGMDGRLQEMDARQREMHDWQRGVDTRLQAMDDRQRAMDERQRGMDERQRATQRSVEELLEHMRNMMAARDIDPDDLFDPPPSL